jgi:hypothetical protein
LDPPDPDQRKDRLRGYAVFSLIADQASLRAFMEHDVIRVWDFMRLLDSRQAGMAPGRTPWLPPLDPTSVRLVNEIVLDEIALGRFVSHVDVYREAMAEDSSHRVWR